MDMNTKLTGVKLSLECDVKVDADSEISHRKTLAFDLSNCTVQDIAEKAIAHDRINWQNTNRKKGDEYLKSLPTVINILMSPAGTKSAVDPLVAYQARFASMTITEQEAELKKLLGMKKADK
jgi:hypothetical protein